MLLELLLLLPRPPVEQRLLLLLLLALLPMPPLLQLLVLLRGRGVPIRGPAPTAIGLKRGTGRRPEGGRKKLLVYASGRVGARSHGSRDTRHLENRPYQNSASSGGAMRQRKLGSHTPPCHRRMVITTLFSVMLAALQRRPVLYHIRWSLTVHWLCFSEQQGQLSPTTHPECRLDSNPCPAGRAPALHSFSGTLGRVVLVPQGRKGA